MTDQGIISYGLDGNFCEECGRAKINRLLYRAPGGCATCDEVITRHRCTKRPDIGTLASGESWECPDCGSVWTVTEEEDACGECGSVLGTMPGWSVVPGERIDTAPKYEPYVPVPFRNKPGRPGK